MHKLVLLERYSEDSFFWPNLLKYNKISELSVKEILNEYQGFEGELILMSIVGEKGIEFNKIMDDYFKKNNSTNCFLLHVISGDDIMPSSLKGQAIQCGYEVGVCEEKKTIYSSIFNEILFGHLPELVSLKNLLNKGWLFKNRILAEEYINLHNQLSVQNKGVEDYEEMIIYEIWRQTLFPM